MPWWGWLITWTLVGLAGVWVIGLVVWGLLVRKLWKATDEWDVDQRMSKWSRPDGWGR